MANIVWDIDGVLIDLEKYLLKNAPKYFKKNFNKELVNSSSIDLKEMFDCSKEQEKMFWTHNLNLLTYSLFSKIRYGLKETMDKIHSDGDKNIICTARAKCEENSIIGKIIRQAVYLWIYKNNLPIDNIYFVSHENSAQEKLSICRKINATVVIEDDFNNAKTISKEIPAILFNTDYNSKMKDENIYNVNCGDEIYLEILKIKQTIELKDFRFLNREEREKLSYEDLEKYYEQYRKVMLKMPYDYQKRENQENKYNKWYSIMKNIHSLCSPKTIIVNPEMIEILKSNYNNGNIYIFGSHTSLDDIQQIEKTIDNMSFFLIKNEFSHYPIVGKFLESIGCEYIERKNQESRIYERKQLEKLVFHGKNIIISPEGTRNRTNNIVGKFEIGASSIAQRTGNYLVPIAIKRYNERNEVYLKICEPRKIKIEDDLEIVTKKLEKEITTEILNIEEQVANNENQKRYLKK